MIERTLQSGYMHWIKTLPYTTYSLVMSGMVDYPLSEIPYTQEDLVLTGAGSYGHPLLSQTIAQRYGISPDSVITTLGASMANYLVMALFLKPGDEVIIETPAYDLLVETAQFLGATVKRFSRRFEDGFQINPEEIEKAVTSKTRLIVLTNLHNPSSVLTSEETLLQIGTLARNAGAHVLVGEVYLPSVFDRPPYSCVTLGKEFISTNSLTKVYGLSGLRLGWILAHPEITEKICRIVDLLYVNHTTLSYTLGLKAFQHLDTITERSKKILDQNRTLLFQFLSSRKDINCVQSPYGTVVFPRLIKGEVEKFAHILRTNHDASIVPGKYFNMPDHFRLGLCSFPEKFAEGINRLGKALDEMTS